MSVSSDRKVRTWNLAAYSATGILEGHRDAVVALAITPDGTQAVTGGYDGRLRRWDLAARTCLQEISSSLTRIAAVACTPDGRHLVESGQGPTAYVRVAETGELVAELDTGAPVVVGLTVAPDGGLVATAGYDGDVVLWACDSWERVRVLSTGARVNAVAFSWSGRLLAVAATRRLTIWSHGDEPVATTGLPIAGVYDVAFSPVGRRLAQTGADGKVRIWSLR